MLNESRPSDEKWNWLERARYPQQALSKITESSHYAIRILQLSFGDTSNVDSLCLFVFNSAERNLTPWLVMGHVAGYRVAVARVKPHRSSVNYGEMRLSKQTLAVHKQARVSLNTPEQLGRNSWWAKVSSLREKKKQVRLKHSCFMTFIWLSF